jgi:predicted ATPase
MAELPTGTVTFLFTDIEGSTRMLQALGESWQPVLEEHHRLMREAIRDAGGIDLRTEGDSFFAVFESPVAAVAASAAAQRALAAHAWPSEGTVRVRMGMHTGEGALGGDDYVGLDVHRAARIASAAHGGQVLLSEATRSLAEHGLPQGVALQSLGPHRLKDLARPEQVSQLTIEGLAAEFPPIRSLGTPTNLPVERTSFVGREREVARVKELLRGPGLLTLTGAGGSGKTRLALQAARELLDDYPAGVFFVALEAITDPLLVPSAIAVSVGARSEGARPTLDILRDHVRDLEMLLVVDNFEQVLGAAPVVSDLLAAAPRMRILVTSREPLHVSGEQELAVPPLSLPDPGDPTDRITQSESVGLFVQRAAAVEAGFRVTDENAPAIAEICRRLDGLPLAIELAASRVKLLSPQSMLERLEDRLGLLSSGPVDLPERQRTLRGAIAWSHDLLDETERAVFRRLSVFAGGWTLEAAEAVANPGGELGDLFGALGSLVDKSLVTTTTPLTGAVRFGMLTTIRDFGAEQLEAAGEAAGTRRRHAAFFLDAAELAAPHLRRVDQKRWLDELELEHDNLRAALRHVIDAGDHRSGARLVAALWRFWHLHAHLGQGRRWSEEVLTLPGLAERTGDRIAALTAFGGMAYWQADVPAYRAAYEEALAIARELGDRREEVEQIYNLSFAHASQGEMPEAIALVEQAKAMYEELGIRRGVADTMWILGIIARLMGDLDRSKELAEEAVRLHREEGDRFGTSVGLYALGRVVFEEGDVAAARTHLLEALDYDEAVGSRTGMAVIFDNLAAHASQTGDHLRALRLAGAAQASKDAAGGQAPPPLIDIPDLRAAALETLGEDAVAAAWEEGRAMPLEQALSYARGVNEDDR